MGYPLKRRSCGDDKRMGQTQIPFGDDKRRDDNEKAARFGDKIISLAG
jgi:hypothetical protein